jgi:hypothetical protein
MVGAGGAFGTDDLALATTLVCAGFEYELKRLNSTKAAWVFDPPDDREEEFFDLLTSYESRTCTVEPWSYTIELSRMKSKLFSFLGRPGRSDASPATATAPDG